MRYMINSVVMSKVMSMILNNRLSRAAEEEGLTATVTNKEAERV